MFETGSTSSIITNVATAASVAINNALADKMGNQPLLLHPTSYTPTSGPLFLLAVARFIKVMQAINKMIRQ
jgi:hypothetical protein